MRTLVCVLAVIVNVAGLIMNSWVLMAGSANPFSVVLLTIHAGLIGFIIGLEREHYAQHRR